MDVNPKTALAYQIYTLIQRSPFINDRPHVACPRRQYEQRCNLTSAILLRKDANRSFRSIKAIARTLGYVDSLSLASPRRYCNDVTATALSTRPIDSPIERLSRATSKLPRERHRNYPAWRRQPSREGGARHQPVTLRTPGAGTGKVILRKGVFRGNQDFRQYRCLSTRSSFYRGYGIESLAWLVTLKLRSLTCVACVYYPLVCRWSSEARRRIARVSPGGLPWSICRRLRNPLSFTKPLASLVGLPCITRRGLRVREERRRETGGKKKKEVTPVCLLVFVRDCSVHVKHDPPTCRLEMKLALASFRRHLRQ